MQNNLADEIGRTVRQAIESWGATARLILLLLALGLVMGLLIAVQHLPLATG